MAWYGLVGGLEHDWIMTFHSVGNVIIPTDEVIFFGGVGIPPTSGGMTSCSQGLHAEQDGRAEAVSRKWPLGIAVANVFFFRIQTLI